MYDMTVAPDRTQPTAAPRRDEALRRCIVCGETLPRERLIRFVVGPDDIVIPDIAERLPGRGLWLTGHRDIVARACATDAFRRAARRAVTPLMGADSEDLAALVDRQLAQRCLDSLGLARRSGRVISGFDQVRGALKSTVPGQGPVVLLTASDAAADGRNKLDALAGRMAQAGVDIVQWALFDAKALGGAIGRDSVVHALVLADKAGSRLPAALLRLAEYRGERLPADVGGAPIAPSDVVETD